MGSSILKKRRRLRDIQPDEVSIVDRPANKRPFLIFKNQELGMQIDGSELEVVGDILHDPSAQTASALLRKAASALSALIDAIKNVDSAVDSDELSIAVDSALENVEALKSIETEDGTVVKLKDTAVILSDLVKSTHAEDDESIINELRDKFVEAVKDIFGLEPISKNAEKLLSMISELAQELVSTTTPDGRLPEDSAPGLLILRDMVSRLLQYIHGSYSEDGEDDVEMLKQAAAQRKLDKTLLEDIVNKAKELGESKDFASDEFKNGVAVLAHLIQGARQESSNEAPLLKRREKMEDTLRSVVERAIVLSHKAVTVGYDDVHGLRELNNVTNLLQGCIEKVSTPDEDGNSVDLPLTELSLVLDADSKLSGIEKAIEAVATAKAEAEAEAQAKAEEETRKAEEEEARKAEEAKAEAEAQAKAEAEAEAEAKAEADARAQADAEAAASAAASDDETQEETDKSDVDIDAATTDADDTVDTEVAAATQDADALVARLDAMQAQVAELKQLVAKARSDVDPPASRRDPEASETSDEKNDLLFPLNYNDPEYRRKLEEGSKRD